MSAQKAGRSPNPKASTDVLAEQEPKTGASHHPDDAARVAGDLAPAFDFESREIPREPRDSEPSLVSALLSALVPPKTLAPRG